MIGLLKRINKYVLYLLTGAAVTFSILRVLFSAAGTSAYLTGMSYRTLLTFMLLFGVLFFALVAKLLIHVAFRINGAIFTRKSGMLYPFPIGYRDFEATVLAFSFPCFLIAGLVSLPAFFLPTFSSIAEALRSLVIWISLALNVGYFLKNNAHDYDKKSLSISLSVVPLVLLGLSLLTNVLGVIR